MFSPTRRSHFPCCMCHFRVDLSRPQGAFDDVDVTPDSIVLIAEGMVVPDTTTLGTPWLTSTEALTVVLRTVGRKQVFPPPLLQPLVLPSMSRDRQWQWSRSEAPAGGSASSAAAPSASPQAA